MLAPRPVLSAVPRRLLAEAAALRGSPSTPSSVRFAFSTAGPAPFSADIAVPHSAGRQTCSCCLSDGLSPVCCARNASTIAAAAVAAEGPMKPSIALLSKLRKETEVSLNKAREALIASRNDYDAAVRWVEEDAVKSGAKKVERLSSRVAAEGVVSLVLTGGDGGWGDKMSVAELCCETDFVSRNDKFRAFAARIATAALVLESDTTFRIKHVSPDQVLSAPLLPPASVDALTSGRILSVREGVADLVSKVGENVKLRRFAVAGAGAVSDPSVMVGTYIHDGESAAFGSTAFVHTGRIAGAVLLRLRAPSITPQTRESVGALAKKIARQIVGWRPKFLSEEHVVEKPEGLEGSALDEWMAENVLTRQTLLGGDDGESVGQAVERVGRSCTADGLRIELVEFLRFEAGEGVEKPITNFAEEVKQAGGA